MKKIIFLVSILFCSNVFAQSPPPSPIIYGPGCAFDLIANQCIGHAGAAVSSFNSRSGAVTSQFSDYSAFYDALGAAAAAQAASDPLGSAASAQAFSIQRANHTGTQLASTISDFVSAVASAIGFTPENVANKDSTGPMSTSTTLYPAENLVKSYADKAPGGLPSGVYPITVNQTATYLSHDGLMMQSYDSTTKTNAAGGFNGGGVGNKMFIGFNNYNNLPFSSFSALSFTAENINDSSALPGLVDWNVYANFNNGDLTIPNDYVNLVNQGGNLSYNLYFLLPTGGGYQTFTTNMSSDLAWGAVGGTGLLTGTGNCTSGSNQITSVSNVNALTVGMYYHTSTTSAGQGPDSGCLANGTTITAINAGASSITVSNNASASTTGATFVQWGGIAPDTRSGTCNGSTTITLGGRTSDSVVTTADLQVNMHVSGTGIPAHSYIVSMVANTSITLNNSCTTGSMTVTAAPTGKTGIPPNGNSQGLPWTKIAANNPSGYLANTTPNSTNWTTGSDGGAAKNMKMSAINFVQGGSSTTDTRLNALKTVTINGDTYNFVNP